MQTESDVIRQREASTIVSSYMGWTAGASYLPLPLLDLAAVTGIQIKMVADLAKLYNVPFSSNAAKSIIAGLLGSVVPMGLTRGAASLLKAIPGVGSLLGVLSAPAFTATSTYAIGKLFIRHFEQGGSLMDFDVAAKRSEFKQEFEAGAEEATTQDSGAQQASA